MRACLQLTALFLFLLQPASAPAAFKSEESPVLAKMGGMAEMDLPAGYRFVDQANCAAFMEDTGNFPSGDELGIVISTSAPKWFAIYEFEDTGYIKDAAGEKMDADEILKGLQEGTEAANEERKKRGWSEIHVVGWESPPAYNPETQRLEWAIKASSSESGDLVNSFTRVLGRKGVMKVTVVCDTADLPAVRQEFQGRMQAFNFTAGNKYAEYKSGDKVAAYGLAALILGGAAAKSGLLGKLGKFIVLIVIALGAAIKRGWEWLTSRSKPERPEGYVPQSSSTDSSTPPSPPPAAGDPPAQGGGGA